MKILSTYLCLLFPPVSFSSKAQGDKNGIASSLNNIGLIYWNQVNYEKALEYHSKSLATRKELGDKKGKIYLASTESELKNGWLKFSLDIKSLILIFKIIFL